MNKRNILAILLTLLGLVQIAGYILNFPKLRGVGLATAASPLPLVFTSFRDLETFSSQFTVRYQDTSDENHEFKITPSLYKNFTGPYNRRNVYGAVISYGTRLTENHERKLVNDVLHYGFCLEAPLLKAFGENKDVKHVEILVENETGSKPFAEKLEITCKR